MKTRRTVSAFQSATARPDEKSARGLFQELLEDPVKFAVDRNATAPSTLGGTHLAEVLPQRYSSAASATVERSGIEVDVTAPVSRAARISASRSGARTP